MSLGIGVAGDVLVLHTPDIELVLVAVYRGIEPAVFLQMYVRGGLPSGICEQDLQASAHVLCKSLYVTTNCRRPVLMAASMNQIIVRILRCQNSTRLETIHFAKLASLKLCKTSQSEGCVF